MAKQQLLLLLDAYVGAWITIQERPRITPRHAANGNAAAAVLLLRPGVPEQHRPPPVEAPERLQDTPDALQAEARHQALHVPQVRQGLRREGGLADPREELRQAVVLHLWLRLQAQEVTQGPHQGLRARARCVRDRLLRGGGGAIV